MVRVACVAGRHGLFEGVVRVTYRYIRPMTVVYARSMGPYEASRREAWSRMNDWLDRRQVRSRVKQGYGYFRDNPRLTAPDLLRYDACVPVTFGLDAEPDAGSAARRFPAVPTPCTRTSAPTPRWASCSRACTARSCPSAACRVDYDRPFVAIYLNDPAITREMHRRTELCVPVLPVRMPLSSNDDDDEHADARSSADRQGRVPA